MKKFFVILSAAIIISMPFFATANAASQLSIYDYDVENLISKIDKAIKDYDIKLWGKNYFTHGKDKGRYCLIYVGSNKELHMGFRLNSDNSVRYSYVGISDINSNRKYLKDLMIVFVSLSKNIGMDLKDYQALVSEMNDYIDYCEKNNVSLSNANKKFHRFCPSINKNVYLELLGKNNGKGMTFTLGAE